MGSRANGHTPLVSLHTKTLVTQSRNQWHQIYFPVLLTSRQCIRLLSIIAQWHIFWVHCVPGEPHCVSYVDGVVIAALIDENC